MKQFQKSLFAVAALISAGSMVADDSSCSGAMPYFSIRSQGVNAVRELVGWQEFINLCDMDKFYGAFAIAGEYTQSFRPCRLAQCLFGPDVVSNGVSSSDCSSSCDTDCCDASIKISGSRAADRGEHDWLADYFGLPTDFESTVSFSPRIRNFVADFQFYFGAAEWAEGLYFRLNLPLTWTKWDLRFCEKVAEAGTNNHDEGYFSSEEIAREDLLAQASEFFSGEKAPNLGEDITFQKLECGKWSASGCDCRGLSVTRLADVEMVLGWNFVCSEDYHFGLNIRSEAPTGNKPCGGFLFEPIAGNGGHWTLGGGLSTHAVLWRGEESDSTFSFYLDANIVHLFNACQTRCFDLCGKPNSRYMLAERLTDEVTFNLGGTEDENDTTPANVTASDFQFANEYAPVANLTSSQVRVNAAVQGDVALKFTYATGGGFSWDLGYNFWGRSCENLCRSKGCPTSKLEDENWALKGDSHVFGFARAAVAPGLAIDAPVALGATQSEADIHGGKNGFVPGGSLVGQPNEDAIRNPGIDNPQFAVASGNDGVAFTQLDSNTPDSLQTRTSIQSVLLKDSDVDVNGTKGISHKIFTHLSYAWLDNEDWTPFLGIGASVEFSGNDCCDDDCNTDCNTSCNTDCNDSCNSCRSCAVNQWAVWVKGGVAFN